MSEPARIRPATPADYAEYARLQPELGTSDKVPDRERWLREMASTTLMLESDGAIAGYAWYEVLVRDGYVRNVVVDARARGRGHGRRLMQALAQALRAADCAHWRLNVKADNATALALYRSCGMEVEFPTSVVRVPWAVVERLPRPGRAHAVRDVLPEEERELERGFGLPEGRLASQRATGRVRILRVVDVEAPLYPRLGLATYDPGYPGCFPFRVARVELAHTLLAALAEQRLAEPPWIQLVVEDDPLLALTLVRCGAELFQEILHMRGPVPGAGGAADEGRRGPSGCRASS